MAGKAWGEDDGAGFDDGFADAIAGSVREVEAGGVLPQPMSITPGMPKIKIARAARHVEEAFNRILVLSDSLGNGQCRIGKAVQNGNSVHRHCRCCKNRMQVERIQL
ncbi:hypothetical protein [Noviherbaspirillum galbum]|uniref:hypothetical protein n=1 Tax=Noviherbaspirillum galbum TaxID=2709383 RepID=UPI001F170DB8|nr:hypothetical protein [Noviherbaspirillum galbum]